jgi:hypothetical protein
MSPVVPIERIDPRCFGSLLRLVCAALLSLVGSATQAAEDLSDIPRQDFWVTDGPVKSAVATNGILYVAGEFDYVTPLSETGNAFDAVSGTSVPGFPRFGGAIRTVVPDLFGGWFVGGLFTSVGGYPITNLVHIRMDKTVDRDWTPHPNDEVRALVTGDGVLYVGGAFTSIGNQPRARLAALDLVRGHVIQDWKTEVGGFGPQDPSTSVNSLVMSPSGRRLFVGGHFLTLNQVLRVHLGSVDAKTGGVDTWFPNGLFGSSSTSWIEALALSENTLYVGGNFGSLGGTNASPGVPRSRLAALDVTKDLTNSVLSWNPGVSGTVLSIAVSCDHVFVGGDFTAVGGTNRSCLAALDRVFGRATSWDPNPNGPVNRLVTVGELIYVGGKFTRIGGQQQQFLAAVDATTGQASAWRPEADFGISGIALGGGVVIAGGTLGPGGQHRHNLAAFDLRTARLLDWNPRVGGGTLVSGSPTDAVNILVATSERVYLGGAFTEVDGQPRGRLAAVEAESGKLTAWNPNASSVVESLALSATTAYAGGSFATVDGQPRRNLAAVDLESGTPLPGWNPAPDGKVAALSIGGGRLFVGGAFSTISGAGRKRLAILDAATGSALTTVVPVADNQVSALLLSSGTLYVGGGFSALGSANLPRLGSLDVESGETLCWNPRVPSGEIRALAVLDDRVYFGGSFSEAAGEPRQNLAAVGTSCPTSIESWAPTLEGSLRTLQVASGALVTGGSYLRVAGQYRPHLAVFAHRDAPVMTTQPESLRVKTGDRVVLTGAALGVGPLSYQWHRNGVELPDATSPSLIIPAIQIDQAANYTLVATNAFGMVSSRAAAVVVIDPILIQTHPLSQTAAPGTTVTLTVEATSSPPPTFQWRRNGVNIPGATRSSLIISDAQPIDGGSYNVVVSSVGEAIHSAAAVVRVITNPLTLNNLRASATAITGPSGLVNGENKTATREPGEPRHVGKPGGRSVWARWTAPARGIATFSTRGSSFDTLLAIYTNSPAGLEEITADEDAAGYLTSEASFNAEAGATYLITIDGFGGATGDIVLGWSLDLSSAQIPRILRQPLSQSVTNGSTQVTFSVEVALDPSPLSFQWFVDCREIPGATNASLMLPRVQPSDVGGYSVQVRYSNQVVRSFTASLDIGPESKAISQDKLEDLLALLESADSGGARLSLFNSSVGLLSVAAGSIDVQTLNNIGATTELGETNHCNVLAGASKWMVLTPQSNGVLRLDTIGSRIDTVLAVYRATNLAFLSHGFVACDDNSGPDGISSQLEFSATKGTSYLVVVDGVQAAKGPILLNWRLGVPVPSPTPPQRRNLAVGADLVVQATAGGAYPRPSFQWFWNGLPLTGATQSSYRLTGIQSAQAGTYSVLVSNLMNSVMQTNLLLQVSAMRLFGPSTRLDGGFELWVEGAPGTGFVLQSTTNTSQLDSWSPVLNNQVLSVDGLFRYVEPSPLTGPSRFFRTQTQ